MMDGGMGSMLGWMMGLGLLGWVSVIALLVTILVVLVQILKRGGPSDRHGSGSPGLSDFLLGDGDVFHVSAPVRSRFGRNKHPPSDLH